MTVCECLHQRLDTLRGAGQGVVHHHERLMVLHGPQIGLGFSYTFIHFVILENFMLPLSLTKQSTEVFFCFPLEDLVQRLSKIRCLHPDVSEVSHTSRGQQSPLQIQKLDFTSSLTHIPPCPNV